MQTYLFQKKIKQIQDNNNNSTRIYLNSRGELALESSFKDTIALQKDTLQKTNKNAKREKKENENKKNMRNKLIHPLQPT